LSNFETEFQILGANIFQKIFGAEKFQKIPETARKIQKFFLKNSRKFQNFFPERFEIFQKFVYNIYRK